MAFVTHRVLHRCSEPSGGYILAANRYVPQRSDANGLTLLFYHCTGSHKEAWEPVIEQLFQSNAGHLIREAWSFDNPNSGEAAALNDSLLNDENIFLIPNWALCIKAFVSSGVFEGHTLVAVAHSSGTCLTAYTTVSDKLPAINYKAMIFVEPSISEQGAYDAFLKAGGKPQNAAVAEAILKRRSTWGNRAEARKFFGTRLPWKTWDPRVRELYMQHALRDISTQDGLPGKTVLCCTPAQEGRQYLYQKFHNEAVDLLLQLDPRPPLHVILGTQIEIIPLWMAQSVMDAYPPASLQKVDSGHFAIQQNPDDVAAAVARVLTNSVELRARM